MSAQQKDNELPSFQTEDDYKMYVCPTTNTKGSSDAELNRKQQ